MRARNEDKLPRVLASISSTRTVAEQRIERNREVRPAVAAAAIGRHHSLGMLGARSTAPGVIFVGTKRDPSFLGDQRER